MPKMMNVELEQKQNECSYRAELKKYNFLVRERSVSCNNAEFYTLYIIGVIKKLKLDIIHA